MGQIKSGYWLVLRAGDERGLASGAATGCLVLADLVVMAW